MNAPASVNLINEVPPAPAGGTSRRDHTLAVGMLVLAAAYATIRYNIFKGVPWSDWPGYIADKVLAVAALLLLALAGWRKLTSRRSTAVVMAWAGLLVIGHVLLSLGLFSGDYYFDKFIAGRRITSLGGLSLLTGALAVGLLELGARRASAWTLTGTTASMAGLLGLSAVHTAAPGLAGWLDPRSWPGGLPPLTLLTSAPALFVAAMLTVSRRLLR